MKAHVSSIALRPALLAGIAACILAAASCASAPKAMDAPTAAPRAEAPKAEPPQPLAQEAESAPDDLRDKATAIRKDAYELGLKDILPDEYGQAEKSYQAGGASYGSDNKASSAAFADAAARFEALIAKLLPLIAESREKRVEELRARAVERRGVSAKGAAELFPRLLAETDAGLSDAKSSRASGDYRKSIELSKASAKDYEVLNKLGDANAAREGIVARDFAKWDSSNWNLAEAKYSSAQASFPGDPQGAANEADEATRRYAKVMENALGYYMADRKSASEAERSRAEGIKSEVAAKTDFAAAAAIYGEAEARKAALDPDGAARLYGDAAASFAAAYVKAKSKMDEAKLEFEALDAALAEREVRGLPPSPVSR